MAEEHMRENQNGEDASWELLNPGIDSETYYLGLNNGKEFTLIYIETPVNTESKYRFSAYRLSQTEIFFYPHKNEIVKIGDFSSILEDIEKVESALGLPQNYRDGLESLLSLARNIH